MAKRALTPATALTFNQVCRLKRDNVDGKTWWAMINSATEMVVRQQKNGESSTGTVIIPRHEFKRLCEWYLTGNWTKRKTTKRRKDAA